MIERSPHGFYHKLGTKIHGKIIVDLQGDRATYVRLYRKVITIVRVSCGHHMDRSRIFCDNDNQSK